MKNKFKALLSCLTMLCVMGASTACGLSLSTGSDTQSSVSSESVESDQESISSKESSSKKDSSKKDSSSSKDDSSVDNSSVDNSSVDSSSVDNSSVDNSSVDDSSVDNSSVDDSSVDNSSVDSSSEDSSSEDSSSEDSSSEDSSSTPEITYTITFVNYDGTEISSATYAEGDEVVVPNAPTREGNETYEYVFAGWDKEVTTAMGDVTYTAVYDEVYIEYTVTFLDEDGSVLNSYTYHYGDMLTAPDPVKASSAVYDYAFDKYEKVDEVGTSTTYKATYVATLKEGFTANATTAAEGESIVLGAGSIGDGANYTKGQQENGYVNQAYLAVDGEFNLDDYIAFDFTGKNMPEIAFFANNYNDSMYAEGTSKQGIVVFSGITTYDGSESAMITQDRENGTYINYGFPYMIQDAANGSFVQDSFAVSALGRANLVDGKHYRVIMGFKAYGASAVELNWYLYDLDTNEVVEQSAMHTWNFFTGSNEQVGNMTINDLVGSIVLYGKFGVETKLDKVWGVYQDTTIDAIANGLNNSQTYTVTFKTESGEVLKTVENVPFGEIATYDESLPGAEGLNSFFHYFYTWDKPFTNVYEDTVYTLVLASELKSGYTAKDVTATEEGVVLAAGGIGNGANYTIGQNNGGYVNQAYFAMDGNYGLDNYVVFDFTGKNMPEIAFFANNYNESMYAEGTSKQGIVVVTGITTWDGLENAAVNLDKENGTYINYGFPYMIQDAANGGFVQDSFAVSALGRANLIDGKHYRVIMGFTAYGASAIELNWCLYDLDTNSVVEQSNMHTWNFFTGSNAQVGNMTINDLSGSIVLYGKFGTTCEIDKLYSVESGAFAEVVAKYTENA